QGGGEIRGQAADRDDLAAAVEALGGQAWQAGQRLGDGDVRQLADVLGGDDLDDRGVAALLGDRALDRAADAGDDHLLDLGRLFRRDILGGRGPDEGEGGDGADGGAPEKTGAAGDECSHQILPGSRRISVEASGVIAKLCKLMERMQASCVWRGCLVAIMRCLAPASLHRTTALILVTAAFWPMSARELTSIRSAAKTCKSIRRPMQAADSSEGRRMTGRRWRPKQAGVIALCAALAATAVPAVAQEAFRERPPEDEVIYFLLPARFANGGPANDRGGLEGDRLVT